MTARESHQRSEHVIEATSERGLDFRQVAERCTHFEAREHLAQRTERSVVARSPVSPA